MGALNVTPDSFSDGGQFDSVPTAFDHAARMLDAGADIIDIGGESTRPGAAAVSVATELGRVIPVIEKLRAEFDCPLSIDTSKAEVMRAAVAAGATLINDVRALRSRDALDTVAELGVPVCLMHMQGRPRSMQDAPRYEEVTADVIAFLRERMAACIAAGIEPACLIVDPGIGFGKTLEQNLQLLRNLDKIAALGAPVLVGVSRKSMLGQLLGKPVGDRIYGSVALGLLARQKGASILRVHDVAPTVDALRVLDAFSQAG
ncbi:MAG: dihydropteroate synthase [Gammaproteobacteria bacterium]|nr:MAG: dihydropteroate synthase [Gammaproteobacteria bacterium]